MRYLLDTCVVSEAMVPRPNPRVLAFIESIEPEQAYLSVLAVAELRRGIDRLPESRKKTALERWFNDDLMVEYAGQIVDVDLRAALVWGSLVARLERTGRILPVVDSWMAAVAIAGKYVYDVKTPEKGYAAMFGEAVYDLAGRRVYLSTQVRICGQ